MSMSTLLSTLRGAGRQQLSASAIVPRRSTGSHLLRIPEFTKVRRKVVQGEKMRSSTFAVGGQDWRICCYPNGNWLYDDHVTLCLENASQERVWDIMAKAKFSILDQALKPSYTRATKEDIIYALTWGEYGDFISHHDLDKGQYLKDDCLTILCDLTVVVTGTEDRIEVPLVPPPFDLHGQLTRAIWHKERPDVKIVVGGETFHAHRWVLDARSPVFKADLALASATATDDNTVELRVGDMDTEVFKTLLQFIYTDSPPLLEAATTAERLLVAAEKYELEKLKRVCEEALCPHIGITSVAATLELAERHRCPVLREACILFLSSPGNLETIIATDGFGQLKRDCSSALLELVVKKMIRQEK